MINVAIADDHFVVRKGLKQIIDEHYDMKVIIDANNGEELMKKIRSTRPDVVILDISMPGRSGLDTLKQIKTEYAKLPVLILSMYPEDQYALRVLKAGAAGYITKETAPENLVNAIKSIANGKNYINDVTADLLKDELIKPKGQSLHQRLSDREYDVLLRIGTSKTVSEIAKELSLSVKTISTYRSRIKEKMILRNNTEIIKYVIEHKLIK